MLGTWKRHDLRSRPLSAAANALGRSAPYDLLQDDSHGLIEQTDPPDTLWIDIYFDISPGLVSKLRLPQRLAYPATMTPG